MRYKVCAWIFRIGCVPEARGEERETLLQALELAMEWQNSSINANTIVYDEELSITYTVNM